MNELRVKILVKSEDNEKHLDYVVLWHLQQRRGFLQCPNNVSNFF